jgi:predicted AlkP superfamily pyrophosphatase or phosphodiesterase
MPARRSWSSGIAALLLALGGLLPFPASAASNDIVVLISIDGLAAFYLQDPQAPLPTLRKLAAEGAVAEGLRVSNPSITWPNHTTLVTGVHPEKHSVLFNGLLVREGLGRPLRIEADRGKAELVAVPTLYDQVHRAGYRTAGINWPCTRGAIALDDNFPDVPGRISRTTPRLRAELVHAGLLDDAGDATFTKKSAAEADKVWTAAATHLLRARPPNLLLLHLLVTDAVQHRHGPQSSAAYAALASADAHVAEILRALDTAGLREQTTLLVVSDHGFARPTKLINPNVVLRKAGLLRPGPKRRAQSISAGGTAFIYLTEPATAKEDREKVIALMRATEGVADILEPAQFAALHLPDPATNRQVGDLLLVAKGDCTFSDESMEDDSITPIPISLGSHGYLSTDRRMNGVMIAWGRSVKTGATLGVVENIDIAPTIAAILGVPLPSADGRVLREMISDSKQR